jgi:transcriptional regulator NrdR family protein
MNCPKCVAAVTKVTDSRVTSQFKKDVGWSKWIKKAGDVFAWYSPDWRVRRRVCRSERCGHSFVTIEVGVEDLKGALNCMKDD